MALNISAGHEVGKVIKGTPISQQLFVHKMFQASPQASFAKVSKNSVKFQSPPEVGLLEGYCSTVASPGATIFPSVDPSFNELGIDTTLPKNYNERFLFNAIRYSKGNI